MSRRNGLDLELDPYSGRDEGKGMVESSAVERNGSDVGGKESNVDGSRRDVNGKESNVVGSRRDVNRKKSIFDGSSHVTSDVIHSIFQRGTLARKKFPQH